MLQSLSYQMELKINVKKIVYQRQPLSVEISMQNNQATLIVARLCINVSWWESEKESNVKTVTAKCLIKI